MIAGALSAKSSGPKVETRSLAVMRRWRSMSSTVNTNSLFQHWRARAQANVYNRRSTSISVSSHNKRRRTAASSNSISKSTFTPFVKASRNNGFPSSGRPSPASNFFAASSHDPLRPTSTNRSSGADRFSTSRMARTNGCRFNDVACRPGANPASSMVSGWNSGMSCSCRDSNRSVSPFRGSAWTARLNQWAASPT